MAYANLVDTLAVAKLNAFCHFRDFLCKRNGTYDYSATGIGWTLLDSSYAVDEDNPQLNDWFVAYSAGENGKQDLYMRFTWVSNYFKVEGYQAWDATTHTGSTNKYNSNNNFDYHETTDVNAYISLHGDLDSVLFSRLESTDYYGCFFGIAEPISDLYTDTIATCSSALTAGSDVSITLDTIPADWEVGRQITIRTTHSDAMATVKAEPTVIKTLVGNTITVDLVNGYTANSKLATHLAYMCSASNQPLTNYAALLGGDADNPVINTTVTKYAIPFASTYTCPSRFEDKYIMSDLILCSASGYGWPMCKLKHVKVVSNIVSPVVMDDTLTDANTGLVYRLRKFYSNMYMAIREV